MNEQAKWWLRVGVWIAVLAPVFSFSGCAQSMGPAYVPPLEQIIESAKSKEDHEALAAYYEEEATLLQEDAAQHERMAKAYAKMDRSFGYGGMMVQRSNRIAIQHRAAAEEYRALAKVHRELAAQLAR